MRHLLKDALLLVRRVAVVKLHRLARLLLFLPPPFSFFLLFQRLSLRLSNPFLGDLHLSQGIRNYFVPIFEYLLLARIHGFVSIVVGRFYRRVQCSIKLGLGDAARRPDGFSSNPHRG